MANLSVSGSQPLTVGSSLSTTLAPVASAIIASLMSTLAEMQSLENSLASRKTGFWPSGAQIKASEFATLEATIDALAAKIKGELGSISLV